MVPIETKADSKRVNANLNGSPSPTSKNVSLVEPSSIPSIDSVGKNVNVDELNKRGQNASDQLVNDVKKTEGSYVPVIMCGNQFFKSEKFKIEMQVSPECRPRWDHHNCRKLPSL